MDLIAPNLIRLMPLCWVACRDGLPEKMFEFVNWCISKEGKLIHFSLVISVNNITKIAMDLENSCSFIPVSYLLVTWGEQTRLGIVLKFNQLGP